jgi:hypothetical protein
MKLEKIFKKKIEKYVKKMMNLKTFYEKIKMLKINKTPK